VKVPLSLRLDAKWGPMVNVTLWPPYSGRKLRYPLEWRLGGPQNPKLFGDALIVFDVEIT